ncbi:MAG: septum formation initiator family protein [Candidatus Pacebacteria bacterium]|nr:septum formation initiator family protein [Candidatus Paceibacterota bacterium]MDD4333713.1 septum formation initiator family protein [Candidatus Paceibacterota bacterium]
MLARKRKKIKEGRFSFKKFLLFLLVIIVVGFLLYSSFNLFFKIRDLNKELKSLEEESEELLKQRESLKFSLGEAYSESYLEKVAREDLNFKKPGETIFIIKKEGEALEEDKEEKTETLVEKIQAFLKSFNK